MKKIKTIGSLKILHISIILLLVLQPLIDLDYLLYPFLHTWGLPRFSTVIRFVLLPLFVLYTLILREKKKKQTMIYMGIYSLVLVVYFLLHIKQSSMLLLRLDFTDNFKFSSFQELIYILTLVLPYGMIYFIYHEHLSQVELKKIVYILSGIVSIPIFLGDLFVFAKSTYYGYTVANIFSWFNGIYDYYHPRMLASKFFYHEGNTIGILLFMLLPILYYFFLQSKTMKEKKVAGVLIVIQSFAMQILATRIGTYGACIVPIAIFIMYVFDCVILKSSKIQYRNVIFLFGMTVTFGVLLNFTPAVRNQRVDAINDTALLHNGMVDMGKEDLKNAENLIPGTEAYRNFYVFMFETYGINARYIQSVPSMYYTDFYSYQHDPKFWTDVTFMDVFDRVSGRQIETIFFKYKYQNLTSLEKLLGMGYSTFMNGSIVLEQDFMQQIYTLGYIGELLCIFPWLLCCLYGVYHFIRRPKKMFTLYNIVLSFSLADGFGAAWLSGHMLDQFITTSFSAMLVAILLNQIQKQEEVI